MSVLKDLIQRGDTLFVASFTPLSCEDPCLLTPRPLLRDHSGGVGAPLQSTSEVHVPAQS